MKPVYIPKQNRKKDETEGKTGYTGRNTGSSTGSNNQINTERKTASAQLFSRAHQPTPSLIKPPPIIHPVKRKIRSKEFVFDWKHEEDTMTDHHSVVNVKRTRFDHLGNMDDRHWSTKRLDEMTNRDWRIFREDYNITTKQGNLPNPIRRWDECGFPSALLNVINDIGYIEPTPIQRQAIPVALQNRDLIGVAQTGSGKTASFVIPMCMFLQILPPITYENASLGPYCLILAPVRELAQQIEQETKKFAIPLGYKCVSLVGGRSIEEQALKLSNGCHIIIATPGRLKDCLDKRLVSLQQCTYVVLDEADRMIDLGFENDLRFILDAMPLSNVKPDTEDVENITRLSQLTGRTLSFRQTIMYSATMPLQVERLANRYLHRPASVVIGIAGQAVDLIEQRVEMISDDNKKLNRISSILGNWKYEPPIMIFVNQKKTCEIVANHLDRYGFKCVSLHSGKSQDQRESSLAGIKDGRKDVLIATDVAGRGIDVKNVSLVINFDMPKNIEGYTHRIGRTGRAGKEGTAISFLGAHDTDIMYDLKVMLQNSAKSVIPAELLRHEAAQKSRNLTQ